MSTSRLVSGYRSLSRRGSAGWFGIDALECRLMLSALAVEGHADHLHELRDAAGNVLCQSELATRPMGSAAALLGALSAAAPFDLEQTFQLHSLAGADFVIYLDFDGHVTSGTVWNTEYNSDNAIVSPAYNADATSGFSTAELEYIQRVWQRVAEDFAPFNVDVTTRDPGLERLRKFGANDTQWGIRAVITPDQSWIADNVGNSGGWGYYGSFQWNTDTPVFVFNGSWSAESWAEVQAADTFSHEVGHALGLRHDGTTVGHEYYQGHGDGATGWAPIMGASFYKELSQWSNDQYPNANQPEDDLALITDPSLGGGFWARDQFNNPVSTYSGLSYRTDDHANEDFSNGTLDATALATGLAGTGLIETSADVDSFWFDWAGGDFTLFISPAARGPNLDILAELFQASGSFVAASNPLTALGASFNNLSLAAGRYVLRIHGVGKPSDGVSDFGYTDYGSLGQYTIATADPLDDVYEQNDSLATAADPLGNGGDWEQTWLSSINEFGISRDEDWYVINVSQGYPELLIQLQFPNAEGDLDLFVFEADGSLTASSTSTNDVESIRVFLSAGQYYVLVKSWPDGSSPGNEYDLWWDDRATVTPTVSIDVSRAENGNPEFFEDDNTNIVFTFTRDVGIAESLTVYFQVGGTATLDTDYTQTGAATFTATMGTLVFAAGSATATIVIDPTVDTDVEADETVFFGLFSPEGTYELGAFQNAGAGILNDDYDPPPTVAQVRYGYGTNKWIDAAELVGRTAPWKITAIAITFSRHVFVDQFDLSVFGLGDTPLPVTGFSYDPVTFTAIWTLWEIDQNRVKIRLDGDAWDDGNDGVRAAAGVNPPLGSYLDGGDQEFLLDVLYGDVDGDKKVNLVDALLQRGRNGTSDVWADIDGSGTVNLIDALLLRGRNGTMLP